MTVPRRGCSSETRLERQSTKWVRSTFADEMPAEMPAVLQRYSALHARLKLPDAFLSRSDLRDLGLPRRAVDACFRDCPVIVLPGFSRPFIQVSDFLALRDGHTYRDDRVRPT